MFENFPYSNFHDLNTDWIVKKIKDVETSEENAQSSATAAAESATAAAVSAYQAHVSEVTAQASANAADQSANAAATSAGEAQNTVADTLNQIDLLQSRVDNIIPSGTQTEGNTELLDIRTAQDATIYNSAGNSVRNQILGLKNELVTLNCGNLLPFKKQYFTSHGITWNIDNDKISVSGTSNGLSNYDIFNSTNSLPLNIEAGKTYNLIYKATNTHFTIYDYSGGTVGNTIVDSLKNASFTIPENCTGLIIRLRILNNVTVNESVLPYVTDTVTNKKIVSIIEGNKSVLENIISVQDVTTNLLNYDTNTNGYLLVNNVPVANANYWYSDYIKIGELPFYYRDSGSSIGYLVSCYDEQKNYIGAIDYTTSGYERITDLTIETAPYYKITPLQGTVYVRVNGRYSNRMLTPFFYPPVYIGYGETYHKNSLNIAMFGDSITYGTNGNTSERVDKPFPEIVKDITGYNVSNFGVGSMGWVSTQYLNRIAYDEISSHNLTGYDVITLCYGVNDSDSTMGSWDSSDETTIMGQVNKCIRYIGGQNPNAIIILIAPWNGATYGTFPDWRYTKRTSGGFTRQELSNEIKQAAEYYHIGFISQLDSPLNGFGIGTVNNEKTGPFLGTDHVHPTPEGYQAIARWISAKLKTIIN